MKYTIPDSLNRPIPIILGGHVNGLGLLRSFGSKGIKSICLDTKKSLSFYSKYSYANFCPDPVSEEDEFIDYLMQMGESLPQKGVLFATNDIWLIPISKHRNRLKKFYHYPMSEWDVIEQCWNKKKLYEVAQDAGLPLPKTIFLNNILDLNENNLDLSFPCILKPEETIGFMEKLGSRGRTIPIDNLEQLIHWKKEIKKKGLDTVPLIIQERIEGPITNLYTITSYSNKNADIVAYSIGHKIRQSPPDAGTILSGRLKHNPEIYELGTKLIKSLGYYGIANTEFKKDDRDNTYKLIEINPRPGMWNYSALISGINLPYIAYQDLLGEPFELPSTYEEGLVWLMFLEDFFNSLLFFKRNGYTEYAINLTEWFKTTQGKKVFAIESWTDPLPGVVHAVKYFGKFLNHILKFK